MSEERGKRDEQSEGSSTPDGSSSPESSSPESSSREGSQALDQPAAGTARPTGKRTARRSRTAASPAATPEKVSVAKAGTPARTAVATRDEKSREPKRMNIFKRLRKFLREVIAELRKVIWPNRKQMVTYTSVVLVFVTFMVAYISGLDLAFIRGVQWLFG